MSSACSDASNQSASTPSPSVLPPAGPGPAHAASSKVARIDVGDLRRLRELVGELVGRAAAPLVDLAGGDLGRARARRSDRRRHRRAGRSRGRRHHPRSSRRSGSARASPRRRASGRAPRTTRARSNRPGTTSSRGNVTVIPHTRLRPTRCSRPHVGRRSAASINVTNCPVHDDVAAQRPLGAARPSQRPARTAPEIVSGRRPEIFGRGGLSPRRGAGRASCGRR